MNKRDEMIQDWLKAKEELEQSKEREMQLRKAVLKENFDFEEDDREGTQNVELGLGYKLKAVFTLRRTLDKEGIQVILDKMESDSPEGTLLAERLVNWKPELVKREYDALPTKFKKMVDRVVSSKPGTPSLSLIEPKNK